MCPWASDLVLTDAEGLRDLSMGLVGYMASSSSGQSPVVANSAVLDAALTAACSGHNRVLTMHKPVRHMHACLSPNVCPAILSKSHQQVSQGI